MINTIRINPVKIKTVKINTVKINTKCEGSLKTTLSPTGGPVINSASGAVSLRSGSSMVGSTPVDEGGRLEILADEV
ncbi:MAG: hypothetical protein ACOYLF_09045 [Blastocatellia bacterium]